MSQGEGGGRPRHWGSPEILETAIDAYFTDAISKEQPLGILALCVHTSMSWETFTDYERGDMDTETEKFSVPLKNARLRVMAYAESRVYENTAGATFQLTNLSRKFKEPWKNAQHQELTGANGGPISLSIADQILAASNGKKAD
jgi:hypothetical protein